MPSNKLCFRWRELLGRTGSAHAGDDATRVSGIIFSPAAAGEQIQDRPLEHLLQTQLYPYPVCGDSYCILEFRRPRNAAENKQKKKNLVYFYLFHQCEETVLGVAGIENVAKTCFKQGWFHQGRAEPGKSRSSCWEWCQWFSHLFLYMTLPSCWRFVLKDYLPFLL